MQGALYGCIVRQTLMRNLKPNTRPKQSSTRLNGLRYLYNELLRALLRFMWCASRLDGFTIC